MTSFVRSDSTRRAGQDFVSPAKESAGPVRLSDAAYQFVKDMLLDYEVTAGQPLSAEDLAARLGMSRQPVMDALKRLESEGFLEIVPQVGCRVVRPELAEVNDFFRLMAAMQGEMAALAAQRHNRDGIAELRRLNRTLKPFTTRKRLSKPDLKAYRIINRDFHDTIHAIGCSSRVTQFARTMWDRTDFYVSMIHTTEGFISRIRMSYLEHEVLISAIEQGDEAEASKLLRAHVLAAGEATVAATGWRPNPS